MRRLASGLLLQACALGEGSRITTRITRSPQLSAGTIARPVELGVIIPRWGKKDEAAQPLEPAATYKDGYVLTAGIQSAMLSSVSDSISQMMHGLSVDVAHVAAMATIAFTLSGSLNAIWLRNLEDRIPGGDVAAIATKTACDFLFCATWFNSAYLGLVPVLTALYSGSPPSEALALWGWTAADFQAAMMLEASTFSPYNMFAFRVVPADLRPLTSAMLSATCTIVMSGLTLGYGVNWL